ncbi:reverse transcriptase domain-containing protein [Tanacetum coccineum]
MLRRSWLVEGHVRSGAATRTPKKLVDGGSSSEVMYEHSFKNLRAETKAKLKESRTPLVGFSGEVSYPIETITLSMTMGEPERLWTIAMEFAIIKSYSPYNVILGRTSLRNLRAVASTIHSMIKFPTANEIATMTTKRETLRECRRMEEARGPSREGRITFSRIQACDSEETTNKDREETQGRRTRGKGEPFEKSLEDKPPKKMVIHDDYPDQTIIIGGNLSAECRSGLVEILQHKLKTYPHIEPRVQRKQSIAPNRRKVVKDEVAEWLKVRIVRKDLYPLPEIDWKIESLMGFKYKGFLDAYKGYHQKQMAKKDEEKTAFHTDEGVFCYTKMPFGLKNAGATKTEPEMIKDVEETPLTLKKVNMKLNPKKCSFGMEEDKFLGYIVTSKGIRANSKKAKAVVNMPSPRNLKQMQRLSGKLAALNRFLSKEAEKALPCLDTLKKCTNKKDFYWTTEAEEAFQAMKKLIAELPTLMAPEKEEELMVYLSAANEAVSVVLLVEREGRQAPIHYVSRTLQDTMVEDSPTQVKTKDPNKILVEGESMEEHEAIETKAPKHLRTEADIWKLYTDGASKEHGSRAGIILDMAEVNEIIEEATITWMTPIQEYIEKKILPEDATEARTIQEKARNYIIEEGVLYRKFRIPSIIITDNETQLINDPFKSWAEGLGLKLISTSVYHPQANRYVERANRSIMQGIKTRLH